MTVASSLAFFVLAGLAGLAEIGCGYLVWLWLREGHGWFFGLAGFTVLALYGVIPTLQPAGFGRVYAAYGGIFIGLAWLGLAWLCSGAGASTAPAPTAGT